MSNTAKILPFNQAIIDNEDGSLSLPTGDTIADPHTAMDLAESCPFELNPFGSNLPAVEAVQVPQGNPYAPEKDYPASPQEPQSAFNENGDYVFEKSPAQLAMDEACNELRQRGVFYQCVSDYHIRIMHVDYYPSKGTIMLKGRGKLAAKGLDVLVQVLKKERILR